MLLKTYFPVDRRSQGPRYSVKVVAWAMVHGFESALWRISLFSLSIFRFLTSKQLIGTLSRHCLWSLPA